MKYTIEVSAALGRKATKHVYGVESATDVQEPCVEQDIQCENETFDTDDTDECETIVEDSCE